jgi:glycosyltransferase involved in cell wall biosynthesis
MRKDRDSSCLRRGPRPRVLHIVENTSYPTDIRVRSEAETLARAGWEVTVISPKGRGGAKSAFEQIDGIRVFRYEPRPSSGGLASHLLEYAVAYSRIGWIGSRLGREQPFDVIHAANPPDGLFVPLWWLRHRGARFIFDQHDLVPELSLASSFGARKTTAYRLASVSEKLSYRLADVVIVPNHSYEAVALSRGGRRTEDVFVVRNGPARDFRRVATDTSLRRGKSHLIVYVGLMGLHDGMDHAVRALARLRERRSDWHAVLAGDGEARRSVEDLATEEGLSSCVEFVGRVDRGVVRRLISSADVCVSPEPRSPYNEKSTMIKILEYMALARPIVAYDLTESRYSAGQAALYARPNDPAALSDCIHELLEDSQKRERMGAIGLARIENELGWEHSEGKLLDAYARALSRTPVA